MKPISIFFLITLFLLTLLDPHLTHAYNGAVAIAVPIEGIMVDGDLSDWPEGMKEYPIERCEYGDAPQDSADFQGSFRIGLSGNSQSALIARTVSVDRFRIACPRAVRFVFFISLSQARAASLEQPMKKP